MRVHILGASGSGTTTLAAAISSRLSIRHFDTDAFYWAESEIPFTVKRPVEERLELLRREFDACDRWVLSGSMCGWGDELVPMFTHVIFLYVPWVIREQRLLNREVQRYGEEAILPGGRMHEVHQAFLEWASKYDDAGYEQRSLATHNRWLERLPDSCYVLRIEEPGELDAIVKHSLAWLGE